MSVLTQKYGKLEGWKWAGLVAVGGAVGWYVIRARRGAAQAAAQTTDAANIAGSSYGAPGAYNAPYPGQGEFMAKVLDQLGAISKATVKTVPKKPTTKPKPGYAWVLVDNVWRQVHYAGQDKPVPKKPTTKPKAGYTWTLVNNVWRQVRYASQDKKPPRKPPKKAVAIAVASPRPASIPTRGFVRAA